MDTLLEMVKGIMVSLDSDDVNTYNENDESISVASAVRDSYEHLVEKLDLKEFFTIIPLTASGDSSKPTFMTIPDNVDFIKWIKYNKKEDGDTVDNFSYVSYLPLDEFLDLTHSYDVEGATNVGEADLGSDYENISIFYLDDEAPSYFTIVDGTQMIFNAYDSEVDSTLQSSKIVAYGKKYVDFVFSDSFDFPALDRRHKTLLYNEAKSQAFADFKQVENKKADRRARELLIKSQKSTGKVNDYEYGRNDNLPNYGR